MATVPDKIVSWPRKLAQYALCIPGGFMLLGAFATYASNPGSAILAGIFGGGLFIAGASIKTTYRLKGGRANYE